MRVAAVLGLLSVAAVAAAAEGELPLRYVTAGKAGAPAIVLLHGLGGDHTSWREEIARLGATHRVLAIDLPGHGASPAATIDLDEIARKILATMRQTGHVPAVVVGHSLGGTIAARVGMLAHPGELRGVVIVDSSIGSFGFTQEARAQLRKSLTADKNQAMREFYAQIARPDELDRIMATAHLLPVDTFMGYLDAANDSGAAAAARAKDIRVPVLAQVSPLLVEDPRKLRATLDEVGYAGVADLTTEYFPGTKHWIQWDDPKAFDASLDRFLARVEKAGGHR